MTEEKCFANKGIAVIDVHRAICEDLSIKKTFSPLSFKLTGCFAVDFRRSKMKSMDSLYLHP